MGELDRFCGAPIAIRNEVREVEQGRVSAEQSALRHAPRTAEAVTADAWQHPYSRQHAAFPAPWLKNHKFWPPVAHRQRLERPQPRLHMQGGRGLRRELSRRWISSASPPGHAYRVRM